MKYWSSYVLLSQKTVVIIICCDSVCKLLLIKLWHDGVHLHNLIYCHQTRCIPPQLLILHTPDSFCFLPCYTSSSTFCHLDSAVACLCFFWNVWVDMRESKNNVLPCIMPQGMRVAYLVAKLVGCMERLLGFFHYVA